MASLNYIEQQIHLLDKEIRDLYDVMDTYDGSQRWHKDRRSKLYTEIQGLKETRQTWYDAKHEAEKEERNSGGRGGSSGGGQKFSKDWIPPGAR